MRSYPRFKFPVPSPFELRYDSDFTDQTLGGRTLRVNKSLRRFPRKSRYTFQGSFEECVKLQEFIAQNPCFVIRIPKTDIDILMQIADQGVTLSITSKTYAQLSFELVENVDEFIYSVTE